MKRNYPDWYDGDRPTFSYPHWEFATTSMDMGEGWWTCYENIVVYLGTEGTNFKEVMYRPIFTDRTGVIEDCWSYIKTGDMTIEQVKECLPNLLMEEVL